MKEIRVTVDILLEDAGKILLVKRAFPPFKGRWALPGGYIEYGERAEEAAAREAKEETGLDIQLGSIIGAYSDPKRDPRGHQISIVYRAKKKSGRIKKSKETKEVKMWNIAKLPKLAFDHAEIIRDATKNGA